MATTCLLVFTLLVSCAFCYQSWGWPRWYASRHPVRPHRHLHPHIHRYYNTQYQGPYWFRFDPFDQSDYFGQLDGSHSHPNGNAHNQPGTGTGTGTGTGSGTGTPTVVEEEEGIVGNGLVDIEKPVKPEQPLQPVKPAEPSKPQYMTTPKPLETQPSPGVKHVLPEYKQDHQIPLQTDFPGCHILDDTVRSMLESNCLLESSLNAEKKRCFRLSCLNSCEGKDGKRHFANTTWHEHNDRAECSCQPFSKMFFFPIPALSEFAPHPLHRRCNWNGCVSRTGHYHEVGEYFRVGKTRCQCQSKPDPYLADVITTHSYVCEDGSYQPSLLYHDNAKLVVKS